MKETKKVIMAYLDWPSAILHAIMVPLFTYLFVIIYQPFDMNGHLSFGTFSFMAHLSILYAIFTGSMTATRALLFFMRNRISASNSFYAAWCIGEIICSGLFMAIYVSLAMSGESSYFSVARITIGIDAAIAIFPYALLFFSIDFYRRHREEEDEKMEEKATLVRFYDEYHKLKFVIASTAIVYIRSEDNYLHIYYLDQQKLKRQILRSSMRSQEETLSRHGLVRCHRSFFVNPAFIQLLHKDANGALVAKLSQEGCEGIPISRKYKDEITSLI